MLTKLISQQTKPAASVSTAAQQSTLSFQLPSVCDRNVPCHLVETPSELEGPRSGWSAKHSTPGTAGSYAFVPDNKGPIQSCALPSLCLPSLPGHALSHPVTAQQPPPSTGQAAAHAPLHIACAPPPRWRIKVLTSPTASLLVLRIAHRIAHLLKPISFIPTIETTNLEVS